LYFQDSQLKSVTSWSHGDNVNCYAKVPFHLFINLVKCDQHFAG